MDNPSSVNANFRKQIANRILFINLFFFCAEIKDKKLR